MFRISVGKLDILLAAMAFFSVPLCMYQDNISTYVTNASRHILSNSSLIIHPVIRDVSSWATTSVVE